MRERRPLGRAIPRSRPARLWRTAHTSAPTMQTTIHERPRSEGFVIGRSAPIISRNSARGRPLTGTAGAHERRFAQAIEWDAS